MLFGKFINYLLIKCVSIDYFIQWNVKLVGVDFKIEIEVEVKVHIENEVKI